MTQTPFQNTPYQEPVQDPGSITPTTIWNPLPGYDEQQQQLKENRDRYFDALIQNAKSKGASLDNALQRLAPLSQSIAQTLKPHLDLQLYLLEAEWLHYYAYLSFITSQLMSTLDTRSMDVT